MSNRAPVYVCVDVETAGPNPADYALLSIGAALVHDPQTSFYVELKPDKPGETEEAARIHNLDMDVLAETGVDAKKALERFATWVQGHAGGEQPIFVAFNAPFDWMYINDYMHHYLGHNPFGHRALDIKAAFFGLHDTAWIDTSFIQVNQHYGRNEVLDHNAEEDARQGAVLFSLMLKEMEERYGKPF
ncbi:MAG: 3'-5' exonuclease [Anaerolineales bacterium]|nr:3'-5' exonuclease [Anaerolineales bacterium]